MSTTVQSHVLDIESRGSKALDTFVNERVRGENVKAEVSDLKKLLSSRDHLKQSA